MRNIQIFLVVMMATIFSCVPTVSVHAQSSPNPPGEKSVSDLWLDVSILPPLVDSFNASARPDDIARVETPRLLESLAEIEVGRRLLIFKTIEDTELFLPRLVDKIDVIGYNLENGPANSPLEQADPVGSIKRMREIADEYGMELAVGPDHDLAIAAGADMAPYADIFVLQVQRVQTDPETVYTFVLPLVQQLRRANPDLQISIQLRTDGDPEQLTALVESLKYVLDGVSILTSLETLDGANELIALLQATPTPTAAPTSTPIPATPAPAAPVANAPANEAAPANTPVPAAPATATIGPARSSSGGEPAVTVVPASDQAEEPINPLLLTSGAFIVGAFFAGIVITSAYYIYRAARG